MDRIDFEELALKSFDPAMGPRITKVIKGESSEEKKRDEKVSNERLFRQFGCLAFYRSLFSILPNLVHR